MQDTINSRLPVKKYWALRILCALLLLLPTVFLVWTMIDSLSLDPSSEGAGLAMAAFVIAYIALWVICLIPYAVSMIFAIIGTVLTCKKNEKGRGVGQKVYFALMIAAPIIAAALTFLLVYLRAAAFNAGA